MLPEVQDQHLPKGGDSLMGRYFPYRLHPLSLAELHRVDLSENEIHKPESHPQDFHQLWELAVSLNHF